MNQGPPSPARRNWTTLLRCREFVWLVIPLLWALAYLPQLGTRDLHHEEGRRAEPAAEMLRTHDYVMPTIYGEPYLNKPPLYFWIAAGLGAIQGQVSAWSVRIPSVLSVLLGAWLLMGFARRDLSREARALAALVLMSMPVMLDKGTLGEIDAFLSLLTFACFAALWAGYDAKAGRIALWAWALSGVMMALAVLTKGPGGPIEFYVIFVPFLFLLGRGRWKLLFSWGHLLMIVIAAVPMVAWAALLLARAKLGAGAVASQWADQIGLGAYFPAAATFAAERETNPAPF
jgi:4-amino-4-deoxy-L-arabinose transferase-like glycosyltransferase